MSVRYLSVSIPPQWDQKTVYVLLRYHIGLSGTLLRRVKWLDDGIFLDHARVTVRETVHTGQTLRVRLSDPAPLDDIPPVALPLNIVYEDDDLIVVNKAAGMPSHPGPGHWDDTLGNALTAHWRSSAANFHPVHRLDKGTSGLIVVAKHPFAQERLKQQLHSELFQREYLAVCDGIPDPPSGTVDAPISRQDSSVLMRTVSPDGLRAVTHYETLRVSHSRALLRLHLETGRTHQIRVHMASLGTPLTGDFLYGQEDPSLIARPALHSSRIALIHPLTGEALTFRAPLPEDMAALIEIKTPSA